MVAGTAVSGIIKTMADGVATTATTMDCNERDPHSAAAITTKKGCLWDYGSCIDMYLRDKNEQGTTASMPALSTPELNSDDPAQRAALDPK